MTRNYAPFEPSGLNYVIELISIMVLITAGICICWWLGKPISFNAEWLALLWRTGTAVVIAAFMLQAPRQRNPMERVMIPGALMCLAWLMSIPYGIRQFDANISPVANAAAVMGSGCIIIWGLGLLLYEFYWTIFASRRRRR